MSRQISIAVFAVLALAFSNFSRAQIPPTEREALIALYTSTDGPNWWNNANWLGPVGTECEWYGVACSSGHVDSISLLDNELTGTIPTELENLSELRILDLDTNYLSGSIPKELGDLSNLEMLILQYNELIGGIPPELGNLSSLVVLALGENQLSGSVPIQLEGLSSLRYLGLGWNALTGDIPSQLGSLSNLLSLSMSGNQLTGGIPPQLGDLLDLEDLFLADNRLSGSIPPDLGSLANLAVLNLGGNQLSGSIPPILGGLGNLRRLYLHSNQLNGMVPLELMGLSSLRDGDGLDLRWNALHTDDSTLIMYLNGKQLLGDWMSTQTLAPENLSVGWVGDHTIWLSWSAVDYSDPGGYVVYAAPLTGGSWVRIGWTAGKNEIEFPAAALEPGTSFGLVVTSYSLAHVANQNLVESDFGDPVQATTADLGCDQPVIEVTWGDPTILGVPGSFGGFVWNTGETSPSISVDPSITRYYWVTVTSAGSCQDSAAILIDEQPIFTDGFESGNTQAWTSPAFLTSAS